MFNAFLRCVAAATVSISVLLGSSIAFAETNWDLPVPWAATEFHTLNLNRFSERVKAATEGEVIITVHPGGSLGIKGPESLRALRNGVVPIIEMPLFQQAGDEPMFGLDALPFIADNYEQLYLLQSIILPAYEAALARHNAKPLYRVPWPSLYFFTKKPATSLADLEGSKMRSFDKGSTNLLRRLGMIPIQLTIGDVVPALASGALDGTVTSAGTAASQKYWEFLDYAYLTNHAWTTNYLAVNLDAWNKLSPAHRDAIEKVAREMQMENWVTSVEEGKKGAAELSDNGMIVEAANPAMIEEMRVRALPMWEEFIKEVGGPTTGALAKYRALTGK